MINTRNAILKKVDIPEADWDKLLKAWERPEHEIDDLEDVAFRHLAPNKEVLQQILIQIDYQLSDKNGIPDPKRLSDGFKELSENQYRSLCSSDMTADAFFKALVNQWSHNSRPFVRAILRGDASKCQLLLHLYDERNEYDNLMFDYYTATKSTKRCLEYDRPDEELRTMTVEERYNALTSQSREFVEEYLEALRYCAKLVIENAEHAIRQLKHRGHPTIFNALQYTKKVLHVIGTMYGHTATPLLDRADSLMFSGDFELVPQPTATIQLLFLHTQVLERDTSYSRSQKLEEELMAELSIDMAEMTVAEYLNFSDMMVNALDECTKARALEVFHKCIAYWANNTLSAITELGSSATALSQMLLTVCVDQLTNHMRKPKELYQHMQQLAEMQRKIQRSQVERDARSRVMPVRKGNEFVASAAPRGTTSQRQPSNFASKRSTSSTARKSETQWKSGKPEKTRSKPAAKSKFPTNDTKARSSGWTDLSPPSHVYANSSDIVIRTGTFYDKPCRAPRTCEMVGLEKATGSTWARQRCKFKHEHVTYKGTLEQLKRHNRAEYAKKGMPVSKTRAQIEERERRIKMIMHSPRGWMRP